MDDATKQQIEDLISDRQKFNDFVYTPLCEAVVELEKRRENKELCTLVDKDLLTSIPEEVKNQKSMLLFRHVATPNYEIRRFMTIADALEELHPVIFEYTADKFTNRNYWKYSLGRLFLHKGSNKNNEQLFETKIIIDFNECNNKPINSIKTKWGQSLVEFHREIFSNSFRRMKHTVFDSSEWLHSFGPTAKDYYKPFLLLFVKNAVLFENFLLDSKEVSFTREVILPALIQIRKETGVKPLIVSLEPTDIEGDNFWLSHPYIQKVFIEDKMKR